MVGGSRLEAAPLLPRFCCLRSRAKVMRDPSTMVVPISEKKTAKKRENGPKRPKTTCEGAMFREKNPRISTGVFRDLFIQK